MKTVFPFLLLAVALMNVMARPVVAAIPPASPVSFAGTIVAAGDWRKDLLAKWKTPPSFGTAEKSEEGVKLITREQPEHVYSLQTQLRNQIPLKKGDTLFIRFAARSLKADKSTGATKIRVGFGKASPDWDRSYGGEIGLSSEWQRFDIPFQCANNFAVNEAMMTFDFGYPAQEAEIADVQVIRCGPEIALTALPKTKRFADKASPEILNRELARIAAMKRELDAVRDPSPANGTTLYVAKTGTAEGDGSKIKPFATIPQALIVVRPGDTILVGAGEYREPKGVSIKTSGRPDAWIKIKAAPYVGQSRPKLITSNRSGFELRGGIAYIEIEGFELQWVADPTIVGDKGITVHGVGIAPMHASHHLRILNNVVHDYGTGGICSLDCDYVYLEGNVIYKTAHTSPYGGSGISLCRAFNFDDAPGYHHVVRRNVCYDNENRVSVLVESGGNGKALTDGNGIIIDVFQRSRANPLKPHYEDRSGALLPYRGRTLVENNLVFDNGGRGVHVFRSDKVDVLNNTCYMNQKTPEISAGELTAIESNQVVIANNIAYGRKEKRGNTQDGCTRIIWRDNLFFNSDDVLRHDGVIVDRDPLFVGAALDDMGNAKPEGFRLRPGSPALGKGLKVFAPANDLAGSPRPGGGPIDLGAYQSPKRSVKQ